MHEMTNIPCLSAGEAAQRLTRRYLSAIRSGARLSDTATVFLWGPPGIGKSAAVKELAEKLEEESGKKVILHDFRLLLKDYTELSGLPVLTPDHLETVWTRPRLFKMDPSEDVINLLFLDELPSAPSLNQSAAYQLTLERAVGEHRLPDNVIILAAGNRKRDGGLYHAQPKPLSNRMMHWEIDADFDSWKKWAMAHNTDGRVLAFLSHDSSILAPPYSDGDVAFPSPRSWSAVSDELKNQPDLSPRDLFPEIAGLIGSAIATEFIEFCGHIAFPAPRDILSGKTTLLPERQEALYPLTAALLHAISLEGESISAGALNNACLYAQHFPADFAQYFFRELDKLPLRSKLLRCVPYTAWIRRQGGYPHENLFI